MHSVIRQDKSIYTRMRITFSRESTIFTHEKGKQREKGEQRRKEKYSHGVIFPTLYM